MKLSRYRTHKVNMGRGTYENVEFGASVTIDTEVDLIGVREDALIPYLNQKLDELLEEDMTEAVANVPSDEKTHAETWRK